MCILSEKISRQRYSIYREKLYIYIVKSIQYIEKGNIYSKALNILGKFLYIYIQRHSIHWGSFSIIYSQRHSILIFNKSKGLLGKFSNIIKLPVDMQNIFYLLRINPFPKILYIILFK